MQAAYPDLPVKIVGFLPGVATLLGVSHQAIEDIALMRTVPNMMVLEPSGPEYHAAAVTLAIRTTLYSKPCTVHRVYRSHRGEELL